MVGVAALGLVVYAQLLQGDAGQQPDPPLAPAFIDGLRKALSVSGSRFTSQPGWQPSSSRTQRAVLRRSVNRVSHDRPPIEPEGDQHSSVRRHV